MFYCLYQLRSPPFQAPPCVSKLAFGGDAIRMKENTKYRNRAAYQNCSQCCTYRKKSQCSFRLARNVRCDLPTLFFLASISFWHVSHLGIHYKFIFGKYSFLAFIFLLLFFSWHILSWYFFNVQFLARISLWHSFCWIYLLNIHFVNCIFLILFFDLFFKHFS